jgi:hypothetical protein
MGEYIPGAPVNDEIRERNRNLPGMGGVFNYVNLHTYHYAGNNPVKLVDPDGRLSDNPATERAIRQLSEKEKEDIPFEIKMDILDELGWENVTSSEAEEIEFSLKEKGGSENTDWLISSETIQVTAVIGHDTAIEFSNAVDEYARKNNYPTRNPRPQSSDITQTFTGRIYNVSLLKEDGTTSPVIRQYFDINGDGHIDGKRDNIR